MLDASKDRHSSLAATSAGILFFNLAGQPFTMIAALVVASYLGPEEKGLAALSCVLPSFFSGVSGLGIAAALKYRVSRQDFTLGQVGLTSLLLSLIQGICAASIFFALMTSGWLGELALSFPAWVKLSSTFIIPVLLVRQTLYMGFAGNMDFRIQNVLDFLAGILSAILSLVFVIVKEYGFEGVLISFLISSLASTCAALVIYFTKYNLSYKLNFEFTKFSYHFGFRAWVGTLAKRGNAELGQLFLGIFAPAGVLGNYSVAASLSLLLHKVPQAIAPVFMNQVAASKDTIKPEKIALLHRALILIVIAVGAAIALGVAIVVPIVLPAFSDVPLLVLLFLPGAIFYSSFRILGSYFIGIGQPEKSSYCQLVALVGSAISYPILIPSFGGYGAAAASSGVYFLMYLLVVSLFKKKIAPSKSQLFSFRMSDIDWIKLQLATVFRKLHFFTGWRGIGSRK